MISDIRFIEIRTATSLPSYVPSKIQNMAPHCLGLTPSSENFIFCKEFFIQGVDAEPHLDSGV